MGSFNKVSGRGSLRDSSSSAPVMIASIEFVFVMSFGCLWESFLSVIFTYSVDWISSRETLSVMSAVSVLKPSTEESMLVM